jgi:hypothetical protein
MRVIRSPHDLPAAEPLDGIPSDCTAAVLFDLLWENIADVLGAAATAALVRRSARHVALRTPGREGVTITRDGFTYRYVLPERWSQCAGEPVVGLRELVHELVPLLQELTGPVVVRRIESLAEFRRCGLLRPGVG